MKRFLMLFSGYRDLLIAKERAEAEAAIWRSRFESADKRLAELSDRLIADSQKIADVMTQQALGRRLFSKAEMPASAEPGATSSFSTGRGERQRATDTARSNLKAFFENQGNTPTS